jgi:N-acyl-L-homoserine lactone synthetase
MHSSIKIWIPHFELPLEVGIPDTEEEKTKMYQLRYKIYVEQRGYIPKELATDGLDIDEYDKKEKCAYVIAKYGNQVVGSLRIIKDNPLPIADHYFSFTDEYIKKTPPEKLVEVGRLTSLGKTDFLPYFPRHLIMLSLFFVTGSYLQENKIEILYGALKKYIFDKFTKLHFPAKLIQPYVSIFGKRGIDDPLKNFFDQPNDPVVPVRVLVKEGNDFMNNLFNKGIVFKRKGEFEYIYRGNFLFFLFILKKKFLK